MLEQSAIIKILIASPSDLHLERDRIHHVFGKWNDANHGIHVLPVMWELNSVPEMGDHPQHILDKRLIPKCDLLIAMFWTKIGTPTPTAPSGTIEEIREFIKLKGAQRVMMYFCERHIQVSPSDINTSALAQLQNFKNEMRTEGIYESFTTPDDFEKKLYHHLDLKIHDLISDKLPLPATKLPIISNLVAWCDVTNSDKRLHQPLFYGRNLKEILDSVVLEIENCINVKGATHDNYLVFGKHIFYSAHYALTTLLEERSYEVPFVIRKGLKVLAERFKFHGDSTAKYRKSLKQYYYDGMNICDDISRLIASTKN